MDQKYNEAANYYGFSCDGCKDNCCETIFYHHTLLEYLFILEGFKSLKNEKKTIIVNIAKQVSRDIELAESKKTILRRMCPVNFDGLCLLYDYRPMICRLHGISHELTRPGKGKTHSPGCDEFMKQCSKMDRFIFDRTPFYKDMAALEKELRQSVKISQKIKLTVAQMLAL